MARNASRAAGLLLVVGFLATGRAALAQSSMNEETPSFTQAADPALASVGVDEKLGAQVPLDLTFRDQDGKQVALRDLVRGDIPVVLSFNYSNCPMLCTLQLNHLVETLPGMLPLEAGRHFRIVTVIIEPKETPEGASKMRSKYLDKLEQERLDLRPPAEQDGGWTFLVADKDGDDTSIKKLADTVGFHYHYVPDRGEWAHPAVLVFLSSTGTVTRYVHGIDFSADDFTGSVTHAALSDPQSAVGFVQRCFHYDPPSGHSRTAVNLLKLTAAGFAAIVFAALLLAHYLRRNGRKVQPPTGVP